MGGSILGNALGRNVRHEMILQRKTAGNMKGLSVGLSGKTNNNTQREGFILGKEALSEVVPKDMK